MSTSQGGKINEETSEEDRGTKNITISHTCARNTGETRSGISRITGDARSISRNTSDSQVSSTGNSGDTTTEGQESRS